MEAIMDHPSSGSERGRSAGKLSYRLLRELCLKNGADDVGFVEISRPALDDQRDDILTPFPWTRSLIMLAVRMHRDSVRSPHRSTANIEFHQTGEELTAVTRKIMFSLQKMGIRSIAESWGFPMESEKWPGKMWFLSHKPIAVAAGLGRMGTNRMILHSQFGPFIYLGGIAIDADIDRYDRPTGESPCLECNLCVATCPTGAIGNEGHFNFGSCVTHNYRNKLGGFSAWVEQVVQSGSGADYRRRVDDQETFAMWQNLSHGSNTTCDFCLAVCPAGAEAEPEYKNDKKGFARRWVRPLQKSENKVFVVPGSDAEASLTKRFPHKKKRLVSNGIRPKSVASFLASMKYMFQPGCSAGLDATYFFTFRGAEKILATVVIKDRKIIINNGHHGKADLHLYAESETWIRFLAKEQSIVSAIVSLKIVPVGDPRLLLAFGRCFPS